MHWLAIILPCFIAAETPAQVTDREPAPGIDRGVVAEWKNGALTHGGDQAAPFVDFSVCVMPGTGSSLNVRSGGWELSRTENAFVFKMGAAGARQIVLQTPPLKKMPHSVVVSIKRDPRQALSGLWIDGVEMASVAVAPGQLQWEPSSLKTGTEEVTMIARSRGLRSSSSRNNRQSRGPRRLMGSSASPTVRSSPCSAERK